MLGAPITNRQLDLQCTASAEPADAPADRRESRARAYHRRIPLRLVRGDGCTVQDDRGRQYLDCLAGAGALPLGHNHPVVTGALHRALDAQLPLTTLDLATPEREHYINTLADALPPGLADYRIHFCGPTGTDAVEAAVKLARTATGRPTLLAFGGAYHGMTHTALGLTSAVGPKVPLGLPEPAARHLPFPAEHRCPLGSGDPAGSGGGSGDADSADRCAALLDWTVDDDHSGTPSPAAIVMEPVQGEGGVNPAPAAFARRAQAAANRCGAAFIVDEVQTGLGRTGHLWGFEPLDVRPDVLVLSKAVGGGLPLAVIVYRPELDVWGPGAHAGTFRGNQLAYVAGAATINHVVTEGLADQAAARGRQLLDGLREAAAHPGAAPYVGDVRGRGLMVGVELVDPDRTERTGRPAPDGHTAARLQQALLDHGVIAETGGRDSAVVRFLPPLVVQPDEIDRAVAAFAKALVDVVPR